MEISREALESKMSSRGFIDAIMSVICKFNYRSADEIIRNWACVKVYLKYYQTSNLVLLDTGIKMVYVRVFQTDEDFEIAKYVLINLYH